MDLFVQQVVGGLATGGIYASLALALVMIHRATELINFAQGEMAMFSTYIAWTMINAGMPYWFAFFLTVAISFLGGVVLERVVIRPVEHRPILTIIIVFIGLLLIFNAVAGWIWTYTLKSFESPFPDRPLELFPGTTVRMHAKLVDLFLAYDLTLAEINPLVRLEDGKFMVLDGHVDMEAEARDLHKTLLDEIGLGPEETRQARPPTDFEIAGAKVDSSDHRGVAGNVVGFEGNLGLVIGAGGGSLTLFDAVRKHGGKPANYCEIGGNPSVKKACELTKLILSKPGVEKIAVMMNVVSNTRVDMVARGVIKGCLDSGKNPKDVIAIFRIPGAWEDEGFKILEKYGVEYCDRSVSMYDAAGRAVRKLEA